MKRPRWKNTKSGKSRYQFDLTKEEMELFGRVSSWLCSPSSTMTLRLSLRCMDTIRQRVGGAKEFTIVLPDGKAETIILP